VERELSPEKFVGEPVTRNVGDDTRRGVIVAYDAVLRYWDVRYHDGHTERLNERGLREHGPPRTRCAQEPSPSEQAITEYLSVRSPGAKDWYMAEDSGLTPYQQRQMAQLATCSDYAVCRGKRGAPEHQLCPCGQRKRENTKHAVLECPLYGELREPLNRAMREHTVLVLEEHGYAMTPPEALRWAIDDHGPGWVSECEKTQASLMRYREALLTFHRESKRARYSKKKAAASQHPRAL